MRCACLMVSVCCVLIGETLFAADPAPATATARVCAEESGVQVCRDTLPGQPDVQADKQTVKVGSTDQPTPRGRLLFLLDIPANIVSRLMDSPERNREYHPKAVLEYRPEPPAPPLAGKYVPLPPQPDGPVWKYHPKQSFEYHPKRDWTYNRDVFSRLWAANIAHDTKFVAVPVRQPGTYLAPVGPTR